MLDKGLVRISTTQIRNCAGATADFDETGVGGATVFLVWEDGPIAVRSRESSLKGGGNETAGWNYAEYRMYSILCGLPCVAINIIPYGENGNSAVSESETVGDFWPREHVCNLLNTS